MQQTQEIARATLYQMRSDASREVNSNIVENDRLVETIIRSQQGESLTREETLVLQRAMHVVFNHFETSHFLFREGFLDNEHWKSDLDTMVGFTSVEPGKSAWAQSKTDLRTSFVAAVDLAKKLKVNEADI